MPHHPEVKCSIPEASVGTEREETDTFSDMAINGSIVIEHSPHHPMVEGLVTIAAASTMREGIDIQIL